MNPDSARESQGDDALEELFDAAFTEDQVHVVTVYYFTPQTTVISVGMNTTILISTYNYFPRGSIAVNGQAYVSAAGVFEMSQLLPSCSSCSLQAPTTCAESPGNSGSASLVTTES